MQQSFQPINTAGSLNKVLAIEPGDEIAFKPLCTLQRFRKGTGRIPSDEGRDDIDLLFTSLKEIIKPFSKTSAYNMYSQIDPSLF